jgi:HSP20 family protein
VDLENRRLGHEVRRLLDWLDEQPSGTVTAECRPRVDLVETADAVAIIMDLPGVTANAVRVTYSGGLVIIVGRKDVPACAHREAAFHLAERSFGRFACAFRLAVAIDAGRARATLRAGELHIHLPRIEDRRSRDIPINVESA